MRKISQKRKIDSRGRVNIPKEYLTFAKIRIGDEIAFRIEGQKIIIFKEKEEK